MMGDFFNGSMGNNFSGPWAWVGLSLGWVLMLVFWGLIIWAIIALIRYAIRGDRSYYRYDPRNEKHREGLHSEREHMEHERIRRIDRNDSTLNILKERYARGEIGREEYEEKRRDLMKDLM